MRLPYSDKLITQEFGVPDPRAAFGKHAGLDYGVVAGTAVYAPTSGTVTDYAWGKYHGNVVQIFDGQNYHRLMHNSVLKVKPGDKVVQEQLVALSGATGEGITGAHVHYDISPEKTPTHFSFINPKQYKGNGMTISQEEYNDLNKWKQIGLGLQKERDEVTYPTIDKLRAERDKVLYPFVTAVTVALNVPNTANIKPALDAIKSLGSAEYIKITDLYVKKG